MSKEAMKLALEALEAERDNYQDWDEKDGAPEYIYEAITALREALAGLPADWEAVAADQAMTIALLRAEQPAQQQEPWGACVSGRVFVGRLPEHARKFSEDEGVSIQWLYTSPPTRLWVGLTDEEMKLIDPDGFEDNLPQMIQQALKEKNT